MSRCSGVIREDLAHLCISVLYIRWYCRCRDDVATVWTPDHPDVATVSHGPTRCHPGVLRMCHGAAPFWCRFITDTVLPGIIIIIDHGFPPPSVVPTVLLGLSRSVGTAFGCNLCFPSRRCNSNWLVSKCAWNKINIRDYLKFCHECIFYVYRFIVYRLSD